MKSSPYSHSFEEDLFPRKPPRHSPTLWKWLLAIGVALLFIYRSTLPVMRLQSEPPKQFIDHHSGRSKKPAQPERRIAQAYWDIAVRTIQSEYSYKRSLPAAPPPEFRIDSKLAELAGNGNAERDFYWQRLRNVWAEPQSWQVSYEWNTDWFANSLTDVAQFLGQMFSQFVQSVQFWKGQITQASIY